MPTESGPEDSAPETTDLDPDTEPDTESDTDLETESSIDDEVSSHDRTWGILVHATAFVGLVVPFGNIIAPLIIWALKKEESPFVDANGKQAINFQITWTILLIAAAISIVLVIGLVLVPIVALAWVILVCVAIVKTSNDEVYEYPLTIEFIS